MDERSISRTQRMLTEAIESGESLHQTVVLEALRTTLDATAIGMGECQMEDTPAPLFPVLSPDGLKFCCTHRQQHCSGVLA